ncbi:MAG TPA: hypothetical protein VEB63_09010 [Chitinophagaceae bacterium]|nr:hypothetical protein [Chitinophagaceae bacterium]
MKKSITLLLLSLSLYGSSQSVFGYWYGLANVKTSASANNYLVELILQPEKGFVKGILNYYFKDTYRSLQVKGNYNPSTRQLNLYDIPITYHGSFAGLEVFCPMNLLATLRVAKAESTLIGNFVSLPDHKYICAPIAFRLTLNADISKQDSVIRAMQEFKETYQVWKPTYADSVVAVDIPARKVINYVTEKEFRERETVVVQEVEVASDSFTVQLYDNGEVDGDRISVFYNGQLILSNERLTHKSIRLNLGIDSLRESSEISMFAENLGLIPPNTALMIIDDGKNRYEARISSSLQKNATIRIRRKK